MFILLSRVFFYIFLLSEPLYLAGHDLFEQSAQPCIVFFYFSILQHYQRISSVVFISLVWVDIVAFFRSFVVSSLLLQLGDEDEASNAFLTI